MRLLALVLLLLLQAPIGGPTQVPDPAYPLRIRILQRNTVHHGGFAIRSWGRADFLDVAGKPSQGFDDESTCGTLFMVNHGQEAYAANERSKDTSSKCW
ncbi:MAG TPA: hypothetical protein VIC33_16610 [Vicinamibacterales bacterium]|jgi:hypothetical protein